MIGELVPVAAYVRAKATPPQLRLKRFQSPFLTVLSRTRGYLSCLVARKAFFVYLLGARKHFRVLRLEVVHEGVTNLGKKNR